MIIGGGIGGLALAQGLKRAGHPVAVYERTTERTDGLQGYRIHINPKGAEALRNCLEPAAWQRFLDTVSTEDGGFGFMTDSGRDLLRFGSDEIAAGHHGVSRINLREILLSGLDDELHFGKAFERYEIAGNTVTAHFADGTTATADVLIGADGANSRVRRQLLPNAERIRTGVVAVAGKFRLTPDAPLPVDLRRDANLVIPRQRGSMFTAVWHADKSGTDPDDYAFWAYADAADQFPPEPEAVDGAALQSLVLERTAGWSPGLRTLIAGADPATVNGLHLKNQTFTVYEQQMLKYGFAAVRQSLQRQAGRAAGPGRAGNVPDRFAGDGQGAPGAPSDGPILGKLTFARTSESFVTRERSSGPRRAKGLQFRRNIGVTEGAR